MHITKNVFESLFATLLNMPKKTKDGPKARNYLIHLGIREELHGGIESSDDEETNRHKGTKVNKNDYHCPPSCFTLSENEIQQLIKCCNTLRSSTVITTVIPLLVIITIDDQAMITFDHSSVSLQP